MSRLLVLLPTVLWFLWADVAGQRDRGATAVEPERIALFFGGILFVIATAAFAALHSARRQ